MTSNELFATCLPSGGWGVCVLQRVKYATPLFLNNKNIKLRLLKWYLNYSSSLNSHVICKTNFSIHILDENNMSLKDHYLIISKLRKAFFYHKNFRSYKLLNTTTPKKTLCNVITFSSKNKAWHPICKLLNTIYYNQNILVHPVNCCSSYTYKVINTLNTGILCIFRFIYNNKNLFLLNVVR